MMARGFRCWLHKWQEVLFWLPAILAVMVVAFYVIPAMDPRTGMDGWGALWGQLTIAFAAVVSAFLSWAFQHLYFYDLSDDDERELIDHACGIDRGTIGPDTGKRVGAGPPTWHALIVLTLDRAQWLAVFWLLFSRLAP